MEPKLLPDGSKQPPPLMCPILTGAITTANGIVSNMQMQNRLQGSGIVAPSGPGPVQMQGVPCIGDKCGFWARDLGMCGIAAAPHILNIVGGNVMEKFFGGADGKEKG